MNCPRCRTVPLESLELEPGLSAQQCPACHGDWMDAASYRAWLAARPADAPTEAVDVAAPAQSVSDAERAMLCPACGHILMRYHVAADIAFLLDHCGSCGGMWFDAGEWAALKSRHLHDRVPVIFSDPWQAQVAREEHRREQERILTEKFAADTLAEVRRIKAWLNQHPGRHEIYPLLHPDMTV